MNILDYVRIETSTVEDGNMAYDKGEREDVFNNRKKFFNKSSINYDNTYEIITNPKKFNQVKIVMNSPKTLSLIKQKDSLITNNPDVVLALTTADCLQTIIYDPKNKVLSLVHSGFRWQDGGIIDKTFELMNKKFGTDSKDTLVYLGNCISPNYYRWDKNILNKTTKDSWIRKTLKKDNHPTHPYIIDLRESALLNLKSLGVKNENILDTKTDCYTGEKYFSHVRSVNTGEPEGRHITLVQMK